jgi:uncharacterized protein DUF6894
MSRYFFDVHTDHDVERDEIGTEVDSLENVRQAAQKLLPEVGYYEIPNDGDRRSLAVLVTDEDGHPVYSATLNYAGLWLLR